ncbi:hypothetical protein V8D89_005430 [Ganoderma adspersum]
MPVLDFWRPAGASPTKLGRHRRLRDTAGIHASPLCLSGMSIGDKWVEWGMGAMDKAASFALLDAFCAVGGNFVDTANGYQDESSEAFIGEWMVERGVRDQMIIATKYTMNFKRGRADTGIQRHSAYWDYQTSVEEVINGLYALVMAGKVLYLVTRLKLPRYAVRLTRWCVPGRMYVSDLWERSETERNVARVLEEVAAEVCAQSIQAVGGRKVEHPHANLETLDVALTPAHLRKIEGGVPFEPRVPHNLTGDGTSYGIGYASAGQFDMWPLRQAICPSESQ